MRLYTHIHTHTLSLESEGAVILTALLRLIHKPFFRVNITSQPDVVSIFNKNHQSAPKNAT